MRVSGSDPVLIDHYLNRATEVDVDALCDDETVFVAGVLEHIEEAGVHSGDSACSMPPYSLSAEVIAELKRQGVEYEERMEVLDTLEYPKPLREFTYDLFDSYRTQPPWVEDHNIRPKSVARDMYEKLMTFPDFVSHYQLARSEGLVLRYLSNTYRALRRTVPEEAKTDELDDIIEWLGETVRQTDSSLLDEWEALTDPRSVERASAAIAANAGPPTPPPPRPITANARTFTVMVRNAMFQKVQLAARDRYGDLADLEIAAAALSDPPGRPAVDSDAWETALGMYWEEYESMGTDADARSPQLLMIDREGGTGANGPRTWTVRQIIDDPDGHHDFAIVATVDLDASDAAGEPVIRTTSFGPAGLGH